MSINLMSINLITSWESFARAVECYVQYVSKKIYSDLTVTRIGKGKKNFTLLHICVKSHISISK